MNEICKVLQQMNNGKAVREDGVLIALEHIKYTLQQIFTTGRLCKRVSYAHFQERNVENLDNYRPINLLSQTYNLCEKIIVNRIITSIEDREN